MNGIESQFRAEIEVMGLTPPVEIISDGKIHRFSCNGRKDDMAGWYILHDDGIPAGAIGSWRDSLTQTWRADIGRPLTLTEEKVHRARIEAIKQTREAEEIRVRAEAQQKASYIWENSEPCTDHPYLVKKQTASHGARLYKSSLIIPLQVGAEIHSIQFIDPGGQKRFLTGGRVSGCSYLIGCINKKTSTMCVCEGFATGASIHEATGKPVTVAFNAGNLMAVSKTMREIFPNLQLIICADDDFQTKGNPGLTKARQAAQAVNGKLATPDFGPDRMEGMTDFNDLARELGPEVVKLRIESARPVAPTEDCPADTITKSKGFQLVPASEIIKNVKPIDWLILGLIERNSFAEIFGESGTFKSFVALDMGLCVGTGTPYHGREVTKGPVVIIIGEGLHGYGRRLAAWEKHHGINLEGHPVFVSTIAAQFLDEQSAQEVESALEAVTEKHGKAELVVIDTLQRNFGPGDENGTKDMSAFIAAVDRRIGNDVTRLIVHHTGHSNKDRSRGAYVLPASLDCEIMVTRTGPTIAMINTKQKDAPEFSPMYFEAKIISLDEGEDKDLLNPLSSIVLHETDGVKPENLKTAEQKVYDIVVSKTGTNWSKKDLLNSLHLSQLTLSKSGTPDAERKAMQRAIKELITIGYIKEISTDCYVAIDWDKRDNSGTN